jgi:lipoprotein-releasing system permease protein
MNVSFFIARRLYFGHQDNQRVSKLAIQIATLGVTIGLAVMIVSVCIVLGFKNEITSKIIGFGSQIEVLNSNSSDTPESLPLVTNAEVVRKIKDTRGVASVQRFSSKLGILKTDADFKGFMLKGIAEDYNTAFLRKYLLEGKIPDYTKDAHLNDIVISRSVASQMRLKVGDRIYAYFFEKSLKTRRFKVAGIYQTNMSQFDDNIVIGNLYAVNQLSGWRDDQSSGLELTTKDFNQLEQTYENVVHTTADMIDSDGNTYTAYTIKELYAQMFDWLKLLDLNIWVILGLMICVASITMISGLLILILEKTNTIGVLKALGGSGGLIRRVFLQYAILIMGRGLLWGNVIALTLSAFQWKFHIFKLDPANYYVDHVPILFNWPVIILLNVATILVCFLAMVGPSFLVSKIQPVKAIRFD